MQDEGKSAEATRYSRLAYSFRAKGNVFEKHDKNICNPYVNNAIIVEKQKNIYVREGACMEIRVLRYFLTVVREEGITKAAEVLHITQPTLSRQLQQLEDEVGVRLFNRGSKKISLTNEGVLLKRRAEEILTLVNRTEKDLLTQEKLIDGNIVIGMGELAAVRLLPEVLAGFHKKYPLVKFDFITDTADLVKEQMEHGLIDIGILLEPVDTTQFDFIRVATKERWVVLMRAEDPLTSKESISAQDLEGKDISVPYRKNVRNEVYNWLGSSRSKCDVVYASNLSLNIAIMVEQGLCYGVLVEGALPLLDRTRLTTRPLYPARMSNSVFAWKRDYPFSLATEKFIEYLQCFLSMDEHKN